MKTSKPAADDGKKVKPDDNTWYCLATLHGTSFDNDEVRAKNRLYWNRFMAPRISDRLKQHLIERKSHSSEELTPFSDTRELERLLCARSHCPSPFEELNGLDVIDFSNVEFGAFAAGGMIFPLLTGFDKSTFAGQVDFRDAAFGWDYREIKALSKTGSQPSEWHHHVASFIGVRF
jgi:hypothetical protein